MSNDKSVYNRIIELCEQRNIKITPLLAKLDIATGSSSGWKAGKMPSGVALVKFAKYFDVSVDYLLFGTSPELPQKYQSLINSYEKLSFSLFFAIGMQHIDGYDDEFLRINIKRDSEPFCLYYGFWKIGNASFY